MDHVGVTAADRRHGRRRRRGRRLLVCGRRNRRHGRPGRKHGRNAGCSGGGGPGRSRTCLRRRHVAIGVGVQRGQIGFVGSRQWRAADLRVADIGRHWLGRRRDGRGRQGQRCCGNQAERCDADQRHRRQQQRRGRARQMRTVLQHGKSPLEAAERGRCAGQAGAGMRRHTQPQQQLAVVATGTPMPGHHGGIAGRFAGDAVFAHGQVQQRVEEEQVARQHRHHAPPQVAALQVGQLVGQRHVQRIGLDAGGRQQQHRAPWPHQLRRGHRRRHAQPRRMPQPVSIGRHRQGRAQRRIGRPCVAQQAATRAPGLHAARQHQRHAGQPQRQQALSPSNAGRSRHGLRHCRRSGLQGRRVAGRCGRHGRQPRQFHRCAEQAGQCLHAHQPPQPALGGSRHARQRAGQGPCQRHQHGGLHAGGDKPQQHVVEESVHRQSPLRPDCSFSTNACSWASSSSLTSPRSDIHATNGLTEPCNVFSTKLATWLRITVSSPVVGA